MSVAERSHDGIDVSRVYALGEFQKRLGVGRHWMRSAHRAGLRTYRFGNRTFIEGAEFLRFLREHAGAGESTDGASPGRDEG
jgi:hypothetical protein